MTANIEIVLIDNLHDEVNSVSGDDVGDASFSETTLADAVLSDTQMAKTDAVLEATAAHFEVVRNSGVKN